MNIKNKTRQELAHELGISYHTLRRRIIEGNLKVSARRYLTATEQKIILDYFEKGNKKLV